MTNRPITLLTDFGADSTYVAQMKGETLKVCPSANIVDLTHSVPSQDIAFAARVLFDSHPFFPAHTIHISVVDPGVGTSRRIIAAECNGHVFIAPDNGLLTLVIEQDSPSQIVEITNREFWSDQISSTFHGRDIMAPVAAHLANGVELSRLGKSISVEDIQRVPISQPKILAESVKGQVIAGDIIVVDTFGNLITNIQRQHLPRQIETASICITIGGLQLDKLVRSYGFAEPGKIVALFGSSGYLEIAKVNGHAAGATGLGRGATVEVQCFG